MRQKDKIVSRVRERVIEICKEKYDHQADNPSNLYFCAENTTPEKVKTEIMENLDPELAKRKYLDMIAYFVLVGSNVFIEIS